jgi:hypothetical protein
MLTNNRTDTIIGSQYISPTEDIKEGLSEWFSMANSIVNQNLIISGDFNARSPLWSYSFEDKRGYEIIETCFKFDLCLQNNPNSEPTYRHTSLNNIGWPDLTITNLKNISLENWTVEDTYNNSDHQYISFKLNFNSEIEKNLSTRFQTKYGKHKKFRKNLKPHINTIKNQLIESQRTKDTNKLDAATNKLIMEIQESCKKSYKLKNNNIKIKFKWWTPKLASQRNQQTSIKKKIKKNPDNLTLKIIYKRNRASYRK